MPACRLWIAEFRYWQQGDLLLCANHVVWGSFLMTTTARFINANISETGYTTRRDKAATILAACVAMIVAWVNSPTDYTAASQLHKACP